MPELPEVETIRRGLSECIIGRKIRRVKVFEEKCYLGKREELAGRRVVGLRRFGKALVIDFTEGVSVIIHLRMTGQLVWWESNSGLDKELERRVAGGHPSEDWVDELPNKHTRVEIDFDDVEKIVEKGGKKKEEERAEGGDKSGGGKLFFNDQRKFGFVKVVKTEEVEEDGFIKKLGKEPWEITGGELYEELQRHKNAKIKTVILDQTVMAGLGNIYADETLFYAGVDPRKVAGEVSEKEAEKIVEGARVVMERSLEAGGSSLKNYVKADGTRGDYLDLFARVYGREGKVCEGCGGEIKKIKISGRGTHFCPRCQK